MNGCYYNFQGFFILSKTFATSRCWWQKLLEQGVSCLYRDDQPRLWLEGTHEAPRLAGSTDPHYGVADISGLSAEASSPFGEVDDSLVPGALLGFSFGAVEAHFGEAHYNSFYNLDVSRVCVSHTSRSNSSNHNHCRCMPCAVCAAGVPC